MNSLSSDLICLSHLRWDYLFQRPQHLMSRFARHRRVFYVEDPIFEPGIKSWLEISPRAENLFIVIPHLSMDLGKSEAIARQRHLINELIGDEHIREFTLWHCSPIAYSFTSHLSPERVIYDCMGDYASSRFSPAEIAQLERDLMASADRVFTAGIALYENKRHLHESVHAFASSVDSDHFAKARGKIEIPSDLKPIRGPRVGFFGVLDERFDGILLGEVAEQNPHLQFVIIGPVANTSSPLPTRSNIHYLGLKSYEELPNYLAHWDVAIMPYAINEATFFMCPTKTPEYLAAGCPIVSTALKDVVRPYGDLGLAHIGTTAAEFSRGIANALFDRSDTTWLHRVDRFLVSTSWDKTWSEMAWLEQSIRHPHVRLDKPDRISRDATATQRV